MNIRQKITLSILGLVIVVGGGVFSYFFITGQIKLGAQKITPSIKKVPYLILVNLMLSGKKTIS